MIGLWLAVGLVVQQGDPQKLIFLHQFELVDRTGVPFDPDNPSLRATIDLAGKDDLPFLSARLSRKPHEKGKVVVDGLAYRGSQDRVEARHRQPSFVLDFQELPVEGVVKKVRAELGPHPSMTLLTSFIDRYIEKKSLSRIYDIASVVATRKEGDCSEHAVLLAALARALGIPARVIHGIVLVSAGGKLHAFGHAWVEYHDGSAWRPADAAIGPEVARAYLPMSALADEGMDFTSATVAAIGSVRRVVLERTGHPAPR